MAGDLALSLGARRSFLVMQCRPSLSEIEPFITKNRFSAPEISENIFRDLVLCLTCNNSRPTSQNIGGTKVWAVPHLKFLEGTVPQAPLSLRHERKDRPTSLRRKFL